MSNDIVFPNIGSQSGPIQFKSLIVMKGYLLLLGHDQDTLDRKSFQISVPHMTSSALHAAALGEF